MKPTAALRLSSDDTASLIRSCRRVSVPCGLQAQHRAHHAVARVACVVDGAAPGVEALARRTRGAVGWRSSSASRRLIVRALVPCRAASSRSLGGRRQADPKRLAQAASRSRPIAGGRLPRRALRSGVASTLRRSADREIARSAGSRPCQFAPSDHAERKGENAAGAGGGTSIFAIAVVWLARWLQVGAEAWRRLWPWQSTVVWSAGADVGRWRGRRGRKRRWRVRRPRALVRAARCRGVIRRARPHHADHGGEEQHCEAGGGHRRTRGQPTKTRVR